MNTEAAQSLCTHIHALRHKVGCMVKERSKVNEVTGTLQANAGSTRACNVLGADWRGRARNSINLPWKHSRVTGLRVELVLIYHPLNWDTKEQYKQTHCHSHFPSVSLSLSLHLTRTLDSLKTVQPCNHNPCECHSALACDTGLRKRALCVNDYVSCYWCAVWHYKRTAQKHTPH